MNKKIILMTILLCLGAMLCGFGPFTKSMAKSKAIAYVKEKYGFRPKVTSVKEQRTDDIFFGSATGYFLVEMKHDGKEFGVFLRAFDPAEAKDNYQAEEITEALTNDIAKLVGKKPYYSQLIYDFGTFNQYDRQYDNYFSDYYDGTNLYDVLNCWNGKVTLAYIDGTPVRDVDLSSIGEKFTETLDKDSSWYLIINLYSFVSLEDFEKDKDVVTEREFFLNPFTMNRALPDLYDGQFYRYQKPTYHGARLVYTNNSYGYEYTYKKDEYRFFGEGYEEKARELEKNGGN